MRFKVLSIIFFTLVLFSILMSGYLLFSESIRLDESQSIWISSKPISTILKLTAEDVHVPLYLLILHFWLQVFGTDIIIVRSLSFIFFLLTLPILFFLFKASSNEKVAFLAVSLFSLSPFVMWYSSEARMYTLFTLTAALNHLFFLKLIDTDAKSYKTGYFLSTIIGFFTHYFFIFLILTQILFVISGFIVQIIFQKTREKGTSIISTIFQNLSLPLSFITLVSGAFLFFLPWLIFVFLQGFASNTQPLIGPPTSFNLIQTFVIFLFGYQNQVIQAVLISLWPLFVVLLFFIFTNKWKLQVNNLDYFVLVTFLPIIIVYLISFLQPIFLSRYLIFVVPTLFYLIALMIFNYSKKIAAILITGFLFLMFGLLLYQNISAQTPSKEDYQGVALYLKENAKPTDIIAVSAPFTIYPVEYSYSGNTRIDTVPLWNRFTKSGIPDFSIDKLKKQINTYKKQYEYLYLVLSYNQGYETSIKDYLDKRYRLEEVKNFSSNIELRTYKLRYDIRR